MLAEVVAMIAPKHDDGIVAQLESIECVEHAADLRIDE